MRRDEPTAELDEHASRIVIDLLRETARRDGIAVLIVSHDTRLFEFADRVITMSYGRLLRRVRGAGTGMVEVVA